jgi:hypothetical protein
MKWRGKSYRPAFGVPVYPKKQNDIRELMKPLSEKTHKGNVWIPVVMNVPKEDVVPATPTPTQTVTSTPTPTLTSTPTPTPTQTNTPTPSSTATPTPTPTTTSTPTPTQTVTSTPTPTLTSTPTPSATPPEPLILDIYTSASAAYSVRKLSNSYTGDAIRVRRSSDNAETDIGFSGNSLDETALTTFVGAGDGFVTTWYDQSGNSNDAIQSTAVSQPQIVFGGNINKLTGTGTGRPALEFDGNNDWFNLTTAITGNTHTAVYPMKRVASSSIGPWFAGTLGLPITGNLGNGGGAYVANDPHIVGFAAYPSNTNYLLLTSVKLAAAGGTIQVNDSSLGTSNSTSSGNNIFTQIQRRGTTEYSRGGVTEMILWLSDRTSDLSGINGNVNTYFEIY